jgi:hypothetical protein
MSKQSKFNISTTNSPAIKNLDKSKSDCNNIEPYRTNEENFEEISNPLNFLTPLKTNNPLLQINTSISPASKTNENIISPVLSTQKNEDNIPTTATFTEKEKPELSLADIYTSDGPMETTKNISQGHITRWGGKFVTSASPCKSPPIVQPFEEIFNALDSEINLSITSLQAPITTTLTSITEKEEDDQNDDGEENERDERILNKRSCTPKFMSRWR